MTKTNSNQGLSQKMLDARGELEAGLAWQEKAQEAMSNCTDSDSYLFLIEVIERAEKDLFKIWALATSEVNPGLVKEATTSPTSPL